MDREAFALPFQFRIKFFFLLIFIAEYDNRGINYRMNRLVTLIIRGLGGSLLEEVSALSVLTGHAPRIDDGAFQLRDLHDDNRGFPRLVKRSHHHHIIGIRFKCKRERII